MTGREGVKLSDVSIDLQQIMQAHEDRLQTLEKWVAEAAGRQTAYWERRHSQDEVDRLRFEKIEEAMHRLTLRLVALSVAGGATTAASFEWVRSMIGGGG